MSYDADFESLDLASEVSLRALAVRRRALAVPSR